jgi:hypothetical protein
VLIATTKEPAPDAVPNTVFANAQRGVEIGAVAVKLASIAALFAITVTDNHASTPLNKKT